MALILNTQAQSGREGTTILFQDVTGNTAQNSYGKNGNILESDVDAVLIGISTLDSLANTQTLNAGQSIVPYVQYICTEGNSTIDNKGVSAGDIIVFNTTGLVVPSGMTLVTTGNYYPIITDDWLPTATQVALTLSLSQLNQSDNTTLEDSVYTINYSVYNDKFRTTTAAISGQSYIVVLGTAAYDGNTYRKGDTFIASDTANITIISGEVAYLYATTTQYFTITFNMLRRIFELLTISGLSDSTKDQIYAIRVQLEALSFSCFTNNVSYTYAENLLQKINNQITYLLNNN